MPDVLEVRDVQVSFGARPVVDGVDLTVAAGETVVVLGPSGCGKSTLLRAIAGLEPLTRGAICWDGTDLAGTAPHDRRFGLVFQDYALFPHRDVRGNVEFGLRMVGVPTSARAQRVDEVLALVGLEGYGGRRVATLSGGEQQRVALARALAPAPRLLMFDEPLGALDRALRERLLGELQSLLATAALPAIYVTHDQDEAFALADRIAVMRAGRVVQAGTPEAIWRAPVDEWTATFLGFGPVVDATVAGGVAATAWGDVDTGDAADGLARIVLRPGAVRVDDSSPHRGTVRTSTFAGDHVALGVEAFDSDGAPVVTVRVSPDGPPAIGADVGVRVDPFGALAFPR